MIMTEKGLSTAVFVILFFLIVAGVIMGLIVLYGGNIIPGILKLLFGRI